MMNRMSYPKKVASMTCSMVPVVTKIYAQPEYNPGANQMRIDREKSIVFRYIIITENY